MKHESPRYYGYWRYYKCGYARTTMCMSCGNIALYEDQMDSGPCRHCGGHVKSYGAAIWVWPETKRTWWGKKIVTKPGYWKKPNE